MNKWLKITRPVNGFMGFFSIYIVGFIAVNVHILKFLIPVSLGAISVFLVTAGGNIINDISDLETDKYNHPERPLPSGTISKKLAYYMALSFFIGGFLVSLFVSLLISSVVILAELLLVSYEFKTKKNGTTRKHNNKPSDWDDISLWGFYYQYTVKDGTVIFTGFLLQYVKGNYEGYRGC